MFCFICGLNDSTEIALIQCSTPKCLTKFHDNCALTQNIGGYNYFFMQRDGGVHCPRHHCTACFSDHNRMRAYLGN